MNDLPTRERIAKLMNPVQHGEYGLKFSEMICIAYADGVLMTAEEWRATIDYEAAGRRLVEWAYEPEGVTTAAEATIQIVGAAVKGDT